VKLSDPDLEAAVRRAKSGGVERGKAKSDRAGADVESSWELGSFTAAQLQRMQFPPISWIVPNIIPAEGVTLLCSKPKFGKSWLAYDLCIACTTDRFTLGTIKPAQGDVLYLALEDSKRRLQRRMTKLLPSFTATWPERLTLKTEWRRLHEGGLEDIRGWHSDIKAKGGKPILAVIDVLAKVRKPVGNRQLYEADYAALADLNKLANELGLAIVVVHHTRKMPADDLMETVSGSYGVSGAVDTILVMATKASGTVLDIRGRDVESAELAIEFKKDSCRWRVLGNATDVHVSEQRAKIIAVLVEAGEPMGIAALVEATGMKRNALELLLGRMAKGGKIKRVGEGLYAHKDYTPPNDPERKPSVASVSRQTDAKTDASPSQHADVREEKAASVSSVRSVRESTDGALGEEVVTATPSSVLMQTDQTDRQIGTEATAKSRKSNGRDLSLDLSQGRGQTDGAQSAPPYRRQYCAYCRRGPGINNPVELCDWNGREISLHQRCQEPWADREWAAEHSPPSEQSHTDTQYPDF